MFNFRNLADEKLNKGREILEKIDWEKFNPAAYLPTISKSEAVEKVSNLLNQVMAQTGLDKAFAIVKKDEAKKAEIENKKAQKKKTIKRVLTVFGIIAVVAGIAVAVYKYLKPDYLEDFEDDEDEEEEPAEVEAETETEAEADAETGDNQ